MLLSVSFSVYATPPDPTPSATKPVREQNLDGNDWIAVHEQGTANVEVQNDETNPVPVDVQGTIDTNITGGSFETEIISGEIDVNIKELPAFDYSRYQLVGFSTGHISGGAGVFSMTTVCQSDYGLYARMCNTVEAMETIFIPDLPPGNAWIRPVIVGDGRIDASGRYAKDGDPRNLSCNGWSGTAQEYIDGIEGLIIGGGMSAVGRIRDSDCRQAQAVACCAPIILAPPPIP